MRVKQIEVFDLHGFEAVFSEAPDLALIFGERNALQVCEVGKKIKNNYPNCIVSGCSTAGNIVKPKISEAQIVLTLISFEFTEVKGVYEKVENQKINKVANDLALQLKRPDLKHILIFTDGLEIDADGFLNSFKKSFDDRVSIIGGLAADGSAFEKTVVFLPNGELSVGAVSAIGLYGESIEVSYGSLGGWKPYGITRKVTKSIGKEVFEIDGGPALNLYKDFLGTKSIELPASGLLMPISFRSIEKIPVVRSIIGVNENRNSLQFAGNVPEGIDIQFMKADAGQLLNGAYNAAVQVKSSTRSKSSLAILISCYGRRKVMKQMAGEEIEVVDEVLKANCLSGFYSYGEIAPHDKSMPCYLHNQTMTITTLQEV